MLQSKSRVLSHRVALFAVPSVLCALLAGGWLCAQKTPSPPASASVAVFASSRVTANQDPVYETARVRYGQHDYAGAIAAIDTLLADPSRSAADRVFLRRQRDICREAKSGIKTSAPVPSASVPNPAAVASPADCGPRALLLVCREAKPYIPLPTLAALSKTAGVMAPKGASLEGMAKAAQSVGFAPLAVQMDRDALANLSTPALAWVDGNHYLAVFQVQRSLRGIAYDSVVIQDPNEERKETIGLTTLLSRSGGVLLTLPQAQAPKANGE